MFSALYLIVCGLLTLIVLVTLSITAFEYYGDRKGHDSYETHTTTNNHKLEALLTSSLAEAARWRESMSTSQASLAKSVGEANDLRNEQVLALLANIEDSMEEKCQGNAENWQTLVTKLDELLQRPNATKLAGTNELLARIKDIIEERIEKVESPIAMKLENIRSSLQSPNTITQLKTLTDPLATKLENLGEKMNNLETPINAIGKKFDSAKFKDIDSKLDSLKLEIDLSKKTLGAKFDDATANLDTNLATKFIAALGEKIDNDLKPKLNSIEQKFTNIDAKKLGESLGQISQNLGDGTIAKKLEDLAKKIKGIDLDEIGDKLDGLKLLDLTTGLRQLRENVDTKNGELLAKLEWFGIKFDELLDLRTKLEEFTKPSSDALHNLADKIDKIKLSELIGKIDQQMPKLADIGNSLGQCLRQGDSIEAKVGRVPTLAALCGIEDRLAILDARVNALAADDDRARFTANLARLRAICLEIDNLPDVDPYDRALLKSKLDDTAEMSRQLAKLLAPEARANLERNLGQLLKDKLTLGQLELRLDDHVQSSIVRREIGQMPEHLDAMRAEVAKLPRSIDYQNLARIRALRNGKLTELFPLKVLRNLLNERIGLLGELKPVDKQTHDLRTLVGRLDAMIRDDAPVDKLSIVDALAHLDALNRLNAETADEQAEFARLTQAAKKMSASSEVLGKLREFAELRHNYAKSFIDEFQQSLNSKPCEQQQEILTDLKNAVEDVREKLAEQKATVHEGALEVEKHVSAEAKKITTTLNGLEKSASKIVADLEENAKMLRTGEASALGEIKQQIEQLPTRVAELEGTALVSEFNGLKEKIGQVPQLVAAFESTTKTMLENEARSLGEIKGRVFDLPNLQQQRDFLSEMRRRRRRPVSDDSSHSAPASPTSPGPAKRERTTAEVELVVPVPTREQEIKVDEDERTERQELVYLLIQKFADEEVPENASKYRAEVFDLIRKRVDEQYDRLYRAQMSADTIRHAILMTLTRYFEKLKPDFAQAREHFAENYTKVRESLYDAHGELRPESLVVPVVFAEAPVLGEQDAQRLRELVDRNTQNLYADSSEWRQKFLNEIVEQFKISFRVLLEHELREYIVRAVLVNAMGKLATLENFDSGVDFENGVFLNDKLVEELMKFLREKQTV